jgi:hypothetical protein
MRRVIPDAQYDTFVAVEFPTGRRLLSVVADDARLAPPEGERALTSGILLRRDLEPASRRATVDLVLRDDAYSDIFTALVIDLLSALATGSTVAPASDILVARLDEWRGLLASVPPGGMSRERQRGLFGELTVLRDVLFPSLGSDVVFAWTGPDRQLQDFQFPGSAIEVKTVSGNNAEAVRVTNERQLDHTRVSELFLVTLALDVRQGGPGRSLPGLIAGIRAEDSLRPALPGFDERLTRAGYLATQAHLYEDRRYAVRQTVIHHVAPGFPAVLEDDLPDGVHDVSYVVDLLAAHSFLISEDDLLHSLGATS